jgi:hypothetical protein
MWMKRERRGGGLRCPAHHEGAYVHGAVRAWLWGPSWGVHRDAREGRGRRVVVEQRGRNALSRLYYSEPSEPSGAEWRSRGPRRPFNVCHPPPPPHRASMHADARGPMRADRLRHVPGIPVAQIAEWHVHKDLCNKTARLRVRTPPSANSAVHCLDGREIRSPGKTGQWLASCIARARGHCIRYKARARAEPAVRAVRAVRAGHDRTVATLGRTAGPAE